MISRLWIWLAILVAVAGAAYARRHDIASLFKPCSSPITYSIGSFDAHFGISQSAFLKAIGAAAHVWDVAAGQTLFQPAAHSDLSINLIYDYRQQATDQLDTIGSAISNDRAGYDTLKARYESMHAQYVSTKAILDADIAAFKQKQTAYEAKVNALNSRGGAVPDQYQALEIERTAINAQAAALNQRSTAFNSTVDNLNATGDRLNQLAKKLNIQVATYNTINKSAGEKFSEGEYVQDAHGTRIDIYEFKNQPQLVRVLEHELGHALGLEHVDDPDAIMYRINQATSEDLTAADKTELKRVCKL